MLIKQKACMTAEITQLRAASERHTIEFTTLRGAIVYVQRVIRWMSQHWDYDGDDDSDGANDNDNACRWIDIGYFDTFFYVYLAYI